jgi:hypothetical protein
MAITNSAESARFFLFSGLKFFLFSYLFRGGVFWNGRNGRDSSAVKTTFTNPAVPVAPRSL